jgi:hypothetical protein
MSQAFVWHSCRLGNVIPDKLIPVAGECKRGGTAAPRVLQAKAAHCTVNKSYIDYAQRGVAQADAVDMLRRQVVDEDVGGHYQINRQPRRGLHPAGCKQPLRLFAWELIPGDFQLQRRKDSS